MKIILAKDAGYCFGVRDAVNKAYEIADKYGEVYMLGDTVHNENVVKDLESNILLLFSNAATVDLENDALVIFFTSDFLNKLNFDLLFKFVNNGIIDISGL